MHLVFSGTELSSPTCCEPEDTCKHANMSDMVWHFDRRSRSYILRPAKVCRSMALDVVEVVGRCSEIEAAPARRSSQDMSEHTEMELHFELRSGSYILRPFKHMAEDHRGLPVHDHTAKDCRRMALDVVGIKDTVGSKTVYNERSHQLPSCKELSEAQDGREKAVGRCSEMEAAPALRSSQDMNEHSEMESGSEA